MTGGPASQPLEVSRPERGLVLAGERSPGGGSGPPLVLLHGLTATRRYVVMGSRLLERSGRDVIAYDARGHGESTAPPDPAAYEYRQLVGDLEAVLDDAGAGRAVLVGSSMGAATALSFALEQPRRVAALVQITPAYAGSPHDSQAEREAWRGLADALERGGIEGFIESSDWSHPFGDSAREAARQRLGRHRDLGAVVDALRVVPASSAFDGLDQLAALELPTLVVGSRDEADPLHPLELAQRYAELLPRGELLVEDPGRAPLAWQGGRLSRAISEFLGRALDAHA